MRRSKRERRNGWRGAALPGLALAALLLGGASEARAVPFQADPYEWGDINGDGIVDGADLGALLQGAMPGGDPTFGGVGAASEAADVAPYNWSTSTVGAGPITKRQVGHPGEAPIGTLVIPGDPDGSGEIDARDVAALRQALGAADVDEDGLTGRQEALIGTNPFMEFSDPLGNADRMKDTDNDGLTDVQEFGLGLAWDNADTDGDGFDDDFELRYGTDPKVVDAQGDPDGDGLSASQEAAAGTNPLAADTDGDLLDDDVELLAGLDPLSNDTDLDGILDGFDACPADAANDPDGDGVCHLVDNCPYVANPGQLDADSDGVGDLCDSLTEYDPVAMSWKPDADFDGVADADDNCPDWPNPSQTDSGGGSAGDACQCGDLDGNGLVEDIDLAMLARDVSTAGIDLSAEQAYLDGVLATYPNAPYAPAAESHKCDLTGDFVCSGADLKSLAAALMGGTPPSYACGDAGLLREHVLNRVGYGGTPEERRRIQYQGVAAFLAESLDFSVPDPAAERMVAPYANPDDEFATLQKNIQELQYSNCNGGKCFMRVANNNHVYRMLREVKILRSIYTTKQLEAVLLDFWWNHFNVNSSPGIRIWSSQDYELVNIRQYAKGYFEDLLWSTATGISMLEYLDLRLSRYRNGNEDTNENFAREVMELHSIGPDETYDEDDVKQVTKVLTGLTYVSSQNPPEGNGPNWVSTYIHSWHVPGTKTVTLDGSPGRWAPVTWTFDYDQPAIASGCGSPGDPRYIAPPGTVDSSLAPPGSPRDVFPRIAANEAEVFLCLLARHPATAYLVGEKLVKRFVTDRTDPGTRGGDLVERLVAIWTTPGNEGNLADVLAGLLTDPEFVAGIHFGGKAKRPLDFVVSLWRSIGPMAEGSSAIIGRHNTLGNYRASFNDFYEQLVSMGEPLYLVPPPTGLPEVSPYWASSSGAVTRWNWADRAVNQSLSASQVEPLARLGLVEGASASEIATALTDGLLPGLVTPATEAALTTYLDDTQTANPGLTTTQLARRGATLLFSSPEFARK